jgi:lipopolysaccharide/colanic/teichoic acid biosynthesis glycosyltransferase
MSSPEPRADIPRPGHFARQGRLHALRPRTTDRTDDAGVGYRLAKRIFDTIGSLLLIITTIPLLAILALMIRVDSPGFVIYRQTRLGRGGRPFPCFKLRTMYADGDDGIHRNHVQYLIENSQTVVAERLPDDPRITRVGRFLRRSSLDELPQLWNVLCGQMSLVGPRPPLPYEVACYQPWQRRRLDVRPGITGYWQVRGRGRVTFDEMCRMDLSYISHRSFGLDLWILLKTPAALLSGKGAG